MTKEQDDETIPSIIVLAQEESNCYVGQCFNDLVFEGFVIPKMKSLRIDDVTVKAFDDLNFVTTSKTNMKRKNNDGKVKLEGRYCCR